MSRENRLGVCGLLLALGLACGGAGHPPTAVHPPDPRNAPLGAPPPVPADLPGLEWLERAHAPLEERWSGSFLENCRRLLPASHQLNDSTLECQVLIVLSREGKVEESNIVKSSGNAEFDVAATEAVREVSPFPPPPAEFASDDGRVYLHWTFARDARRATPGTARFFRKDLPPERAVPALLAARRPAEALDRLVAAQAQGGSDPEKLVALSRDAVGALLVWRLVDSKNPDAQVQAARALGKVRWSMATPSLAEIAGDAPGLELQSAAIESLAMLGDANLADWLVTLLLPLGGERSLAAATALHTLRRGDAVWPHVQAALAEPATREAALETLLRAPTALAVPVLVPLCQDKQGTRQLRSQCYEALGACAMGQNGEATTALGRALAEPDAGLRTAAALGLVVAGRAGLRSKGAFYRLLPLTNDRDARVREQAVLAAAAVWPQGAASELTAMARKSAPARVTVRFAQALAPLPGPAVVDSLLALSRQPNIEVRRAAFAALVGRAEPAAQQALTQAAKDVDGGIRASAATAVTVPVARTMVADPDPAVRIAAFRTLLRVEKPATLLGTLAELLAGATPLESVALLAAWLEASA